MQFRLLILGGAGATLVALALPAPSLSQQPAASTTATVIGIVRDASSGAVVVGAQVIIDTSGPSSSTDEQGRFSVARVPIGTHRLHVRRFGYQELDQALTVSDQMPGLDLKLQPDPVQLAELSTPGREKADFTGGVKDALTGAILPWADVSLAGTGGKQVGRLSTSDLDGRFRVADIPTGGYLLKVERLGYANRYIAVEQRIPSEPLEVTMEPDEVFQRGLLLMTTEYDERLNSSGHATFEIGEIDLRLAGNISMKEFFERRLVAPAGRLFIDEAPITDVTMIDSYDTGAFYRIDIVQCAGSASAGGSQRIRNTEIHAYTYEYIDRMARRPRIPQPLMC